MNVNCISQSAGYSCWYRLFWNGRLIVLVILKVVFWFTVKSLMSWCPPTRTLVNLKYMKPCYEVLVHTGACANNVKYWLHFYVGCRKKAKKRRLWQSKQPTDIPPQAPQFRHQSRHPSRHHPHQVMSQPATAKRKRYDWQWTMHVDSMFVVTRMNTCVL